MSKLFITSCAGIRINKINSNQAITIIKSRYKDKVWVIYENGELQENDQPPVLIDYEKALELTRDPKVQGEAIKNAASPESISFLPRWKWPAREERGRNA